MGWGRDGGLVPVIPLVECLPVVIDGRAIRPPIVIVVLVGGVAAALQPDLVVHLRAVVGTEGLVQSRVEVRVRDRALPCAVVVRPRVEDAERAGVAGGGGRGGGDAHDQMVHRIRWNASG